MFSMHVLSSTVHLSMLSFPVGIANSLSYAHCEVWFEACLEVGGSGRSLHI